MDCGVPQARVAEQQRLRLVCAEPAIAHPRLKMGDDVPRVKRVIALQRPEARSVKHDRVVEGRRVDRISIDEIRRKRHSGRTWGRAAETTSARVVHEKTGLGTSHREVDRVIHRERSDPDWNRTVAANSDRVIERQLTERHGLAIRSAIQRSGGLSHRFDRHDRR